MKKTLYSICAVFLLVFFLIPFGVTGQETTAEETTTEDTGQEPVELVNVMPLSEASGEAGKEMNYARVSLLINTRIQTAQAVIEYFNENYPEIDTGSVEDYLSELESIIDDLTTESDFEAIMQEVAALIEDQKAGMGQFVIENNVDVEALKAAIEAYKKEHAEELGELKASWGETRATYVYARGDVSVGQFENFLTIAETYLDLDPDAVADINAFKALIEERNALIDDLAAAAQNFDDEAVFEISAEIKEITQQIKELAKDLREQINAARQEEMQATGTVGTKPEFVAQSTGTKPAFVAQSAGTRPEFVVRDRPPLRRGENPSRAQHIPLPIAGQIQSDEVSGG